MRNLVILSLFALASCSHDAIAPANYSAQKGVPKAKDAAESAAGVRSATNALNQNAIRVEARADSISRESSSLRAALSSATSEADRLRKLDALTKEEMAQLWAQLTQITHQSIMLEDQAKATIADLKEQKALRAEADARIAEMETAARNKDLEAVLLRTQYEDEKAVAVNASQLAIDNNKAAITWRSEADKAKGRLAFYDLILIIVGIILLAYAFIRWGWPLVRKSFIGR